MRAVCWATIGFPRFRSSAPTVCSGEITYEAAPEAFRFTQGLKKTDDEKDALTTLRVGTGDNFAPFLLARQMWIPSTEELDEKEHYEGSEHGWKRGDKLTDKEEEVLLSGGGSIPVDNVGCFFRRIKFDALVPGKHDFYFGPSRLRQLASFLATPAGEKSDEQATRMLGVNLVLQTKELTLSQASKPSANNLKDRPPTIDKVPGKQLPTIAMPKVVLPWMRTVEVKNGMAGAAICIVDVERLKKTLPKKTSELKDMPPAQTQRICDNAEFTLSGPSPAASSVRSDSSRYVH